MSTGGDKYKGNPVQWLVFFAFLVFFTWAFQSWAITPAFRTAMISLFATPSAHKKAESGASVVETDDFVLDMSSNTKKVDANGNGYDKDSGEWIIRSERLGEEAIHIQPWVTFGIFSLFFGFIVAVVATAMLPRPIGYISNKIEREIDNTINRIDEQTGDKISREEIERITAANSHDDLSPIEKQFGPVIVSEIEDVRQARKWQRAKPLVFKGLRLYMTRHFAEQYANNVQGFAYGGAAILIVIIGIRGLKFIPPTQPSILLAAITLEFSMLTLLAVTLFYTEEEQRMDKLMRNLEESSEGQKYELINLVRTSQQQQRDLAAMVDYIQRQTDNLQRMADALTGANREYIIQVAQRAVTEYITAETSREITEKVIREKVDAALANMFGKQQQLGE
ncbi:MAG TPA: hypothetical protein VHI13_09850 [Candidatus Kapabacteria bacterium]|nr:hypothetical protein [Candidatus Kapabacteria bacterium]